MASKALIAKLRGVMPKQSTIDLDEHAKLIAEQVTRARATARSKVLAAVRFRKVEQ